MEENIKKLNEVIEISKNSNEMLEEVGKSLKELNKKLSSLVESKSIAAEMAERKRLKYVEEMQEDIIAAASESLEKAMDMLKNKWITEAQYIEIVRKGVK